LVVEDNDSVRELAREALSGDGYCVLEARNGEEALHFVSKHPAIALVLTDVVMPIMGGRELAVRLAELRRDLKVIFTSGYTHGAIVGREALETAFIQKPFTPAVLGRAVREALDGQASKG
jgi:two-component system cell cycle sensor histidine kinase/response regulator CckA